VNTALIVDVVAETERKKGTKTNRTKQVDDADAEKKQNPPSMLFSVLAHVSSKKTSIRFGDPM